MKTWSIMLALPHHHDLNMLVEASHVLVCRQVIGLDAHNLACPTHFVLHNTISATSHTAHQSTYVICTSHDKTFDNHHDALDLLEVSYSNVM